VSARGASTARPTAELIDREVREIIGVQYKRSLEILGGHKEVLERGAKVLLEKEKIEGRELQEIMEAVAVAQRTGGDVGQGE
jgi:cell division protease FtsH